MISSKTPEAAPRAAIEAPAPDNGVLGLGLRVWGLGFRVSGLSKSPCIQGLHTHSLPVSRCKAQKSPNLSKPVECPAKKPVQPLTKRNCPAPQGPLHLKLTSTLQPYCPNPRPLQHHMNPCETYKTHIKPCKDPITPQPLTPSPPASSASRAASGAGSAAFCLKRSKAGILPEPPMCGLGFA